MGEGWEKFPFPSSNRAKLATDRNPECFFHSCNLVEVTWSKLNVS